MKKNIIITLLAFFCCINAASADDFISTNSVDMKYKGFSDHMIYIAELQKSRQENIHVFQPPSKFKTWITRHIRLDYAFTTEPFGWYTLDRGEE